MCQVINNSRCRLSKKIHADRKKNGINQTGENDPFPKPVFYNKIMCLKIGLNSYDDFFQQDLDLCKYKEKL
jgi:hypothetical protein